MIKRVYQNSVLYGLNVTKVMAFFGVSYKKAKKLLQAFKESELFIYNEKKQALFAKSLKSGDFYYYGKGKVKYKAFADFCVKLQMKGDVSLRRVVRELRNSLILNAVNNVERSCGDGLIKVCQTSNTVTKLPKSAVIPQRKLGKAIGMSRATASKYVNKLVDDGRVGKTLIVAENVIECLNEITENALRLANPKQQFFAWHAVNYGGWSAWYIYGYAYAILSREDSKALQHVIYNYDRGRKKDEVQPKTSSEIDGKWC